MERWGTSKAYIWETAPFLRILLPFIIGIWGYDKGWFIVSEVWILPLLILVSVCVFIGLVFLRKKHQLFAQSSFILFNIILFVAGYAIAYKNDIRNNPNWFGRIPKHVAIARITENPIEKEKTWKIRVNILNTLINGKVLTTTGNAFVYVSKDVTPFLLHKGDTVLLPTKWEPIKNAGNPFEFDYAQYCRRNNLFYTQFCTNNAISLYGKGLPAATPILEKSHDWCMAQIDTYIKDTIAKGLIQAMLLGDEVNLDEQLRQAWAETGIVHVIAISGGNVLIFFEILALAFFWLRHKKHWWIKYLVAIPLVWLYVLMAGSSPSAIRAAMMFSFFAIALIAQKNTNSINQLFAATFMLLLVEPMWLFSVGLQLSFIAVLSLLLFYRPVYKWLSPANKFTNKHLQKTNTALLQTIAASIAAEILVAPLVIYYFHNFPLLFIIANVAAFIFMTIVLYLSIALVALGLFPPLAKMIGFVITMLVKWFNVIVACLQYGNPISFRYIHLSRIELVLVYVVILCVCYFLINKHKQLLFIGLGICVMLLLLFCQDQWTALHQHRLVIYNAGKPNHIELIAGKKHWVLQTDTTASQKMNYATNPAHIYWAAWDRDKDRRSNIWHNNTEVLQIMGKTILILKQAVFYRLPFHVDYLVIDYRGIIDPIKLQQIFSPNNIIICNKVTKIQITKLKRKISNKTIKIFNIKEDGAFVL